MWNQFIELPANKWRRDAIIVSPDQQGGQLDLAKLIPKVIFDGGAGQRDDFQGLHPFIDNLVYLIHQFLGSSVGIVESHFCLLTDVFIIATLGIGVTHSIFEKTRASGEYQRFYFGRSFEHVHQGDMATQRVAKHVYSPITTVINEFGQVFFQATHCGVQQVKLKQRQKRYNNLMGLAKMADDASKIAHGTK